MEYILAVILLILVLVAAAATVAAVKTTRAVRRKVEQTVPQARRMVEDTTLKARSYTRPGAAGEIAQLRLSVRTSVDSTRQVLRAALPEDPALHESLALLARLEEHAGALDAELKGLEREPDRARAAQRLPELRERAGRITHAAESLRWAVRDRSRRFAADDLASLSAQIETEAGALRHWEPTEGREPAGGRTAGPAGASGAPGTADAPGAAGEGASRPAITGGDPLRKSTRLPWEEPARERGEQRDHRPRNGS
ncbi:hypothetical protein GQS52_18660 [Streptomyces sp. SCUT-3]|uniref:tetratricopeptide repeat protein n=1 Tax=unclassified Streptomyces TaxID=2593676 RepID=UPI0015FD2767|nr:MULTISPECIES: hypothetical protein [unclassified Streptomyces]MCZ2523172.1 hypothetical protein [Streptomyces sp. HB2AG]QMV23456.1 hypothetical protein GQS52_18660 [Streptomyces sp. SCUT-3]